MNFCLNLDKYFNHRLFKSYMWEMRTDLEKRKYYGIPHYIDIHIIDKCFTNFSYKGVLFKHNKNADSSFDNIICDGQYIEMKENLINCIYVLGFCEYGTVCDNIILHTEYKDISVPIVMKTFHSDSLKGLNDVGENKNCEFVFYLNGDDGQKHSVYFWKSIVEKNEKIKGIELPVNLSMHIMALSVNIIF